MRDALLSMYRPASTLFVCTCLGVLAGGGCDEAPARPQVELFIDVDMAVPLQITDEISADAAVDTLRIDVFAGDRDPIESRILSLLSADDLPLSFGIPSSAAADGRVIVRIRAFRSIFATPGEQDGAVVLDPRPEVTVDRLVALTLPAEGIETKSVVLHGECIGTPVRFGVGGEADRTCIDADNLDALSTDAIASGAPTTSAGTWSRAQVRECEGEAPAGAICIPGGLAVLGDAQFLPLTEFEINFAPVPLRVVWLDPFYMDRTEITVGDLRSLIGAGYVGPLPAPVDPAHTLRKNCTWDPASADDLPVNCISFEVADEVCAFRGGTVPSEAQWEHAARGRGARRIYPWGDEDPDCCSASVARFQDGDCDEELEIEAAASHLGEGDCLGDVSRDGVVDLAGSMTELMRDSLASFGDPCWSHVEGAPRILDNRVCIGATGRMGRGASWSGTFGQVPLPIRESFSQAHPGNGFRCVYEAAL